MLKMSLDFYWFKRQTHNYDRIFIEIFTLSKFLGVLMNSCLPNKRPPHVIEVGFNYFWDWNQSPIGRQF